MRGDNPLRTTASLNDMPLTTAQRRTLRTSCELIVPGFASLIPAEEFAQMSAWCEANGVAHDTYGDGALVNDFEAKVANLLGKPAAVFMPSGIMAQSAALKIWTDRAALPRFGMHATCHLANHEEQAYSALLHCHGVIVGDRSRPILAGDLDAVHQELACLIVELPLREIGGPLPSWEELEALKSKARERGIPLHMDGARLWECAAFYEKNYSDIASGFDSVYVSFYKGIGAVSGAMLSGDEAFVSNARLWRRRLGGTLYHLSPMVVSAAMRFDARIALMPALFARALELADGLQASGTVLVKPGRLQSNMMHLYFRAEPEAIKQARDDLASSTGCWLFDGVNATDVPGWSTTELYVGDNLLRADLPRVVDLFSRLVAMATAE